MASLRRDEYDKTGTVDIEQAKIEWAKAIAQARILQNKLM